MSGFQTYINRDLPVGVEGDFASVNPWYSLQSPVGGNFRAGTDGVKIGTFAWVDMDTGLASNTKGSLKIGGFIGRQNQAVVFTDEEGSLVIPKGRGVTLYKSGDFWARFPNGATAGQLVVADSATGVLSAVDAIADGAIDTGYVIATNCSTNELAKIQGK